MKINHPQKKISVTSIAKENHNDREHEFYDVLMERAKQTTEEKWNQKLEKYMNKDLTRENARMKTKKKCICIYTKQNSYKHI